jgi:hypothetical protein
MHVSFGAKNNTCMPFREITHQNSAMNAKN